jgi:hypothetical protein
MNQKYAKTTMLLFEARTTVRGFVAPGILALLNGWKNDMAHLAV